MQNPVDTSALAFQIEAMRRFGRFYTRYLGALNEGLLNSPFSLTEARVLYEIAHHEATDAATLCAELGLDTGYMSRVLNSLEAKALVAKSSATHDRRVKHLSLTTNGERTFATLNAASASNVESALMTLDDAQRQQLIASMKTIETLLTGTPVQRVPYILRPHQPGDLGWVVQRHGAIYAREYHWNVEFEGLTAEIVGMFVRNFDSQRERCWIAEKDGANVGCVFVVKKSDEIAQLRMLLVEQSARGLGIGQRLVQECTRFARHAGYRSITLWTNKNLESARRIYQKEGYKLTTEEPHHSFGHDLIGESWEKAL